MSLNILLFDVENSPCLSYIWGLYNEVTCTTMLEKDWYVLCWSAKWLDESKVYSSALPDYSLYDKEKDNDKQVMKELWNLLDGADVVIAHNAVNFDVRKVNTRFLFHGMTPPSPYKIVDTLKVARRYFSFTSNKLDDLGKFLKVGKKAETGGFDLWRGCMNGDMKSWKKMVKYCKQDVRLLEKVYLKLRPYIKTHPNRTVENLDKITCPKCSSKNVSKDGTRTYVSGQVQMYRCNDCGGYAQSYISKKKQHLLRNA